MKRIYAQLIAGLLLSATLACVEDAPGFPPPQGQLYFPIGITLASPAADQDLLLVANSNFDQRYNAGFISVLDVGVMFSLAEGGNGELRYLPNFGDDAGGANAFRSQVKVPMLGGEILFVPASSGRDDARVFIPSRGKNLVTMLSLGADGRLDCGNSGPGGAIDPMVGIDCTAAHVVRTLFDDPYSLAYVPSMGGRGLVAVGHLSVARDSSQQLLSGLTLLDVERFDAWVASEAGGNVVGSPEAAGYPARTFHYGDFGGSSGLALGAGTLGVGTPLLGASRQLNPGLPLTVFSPEPDSQGFNLRRVGALDLSSASSAIEMRGLALSGNRAYLSVRFAEAETAYNAGVAVVALGASSLSLVSLIEVGDELAKPTLLERGSQRLLYVPDLRDDRIWIVDVSSDEPVVAAVLAGRAQRTIDGQTVQARILASPSEILFATRGARTLGFVSNFANSTLSVIDVSDPDPRKHALIMRLGRDFDADGKTEAEQ